MKKVPLYDRIQRFLGAFPNATRITVHPSDYYVLEKSGHLGSFRLPIEALGGEKCYNEWLEERDLMVRRAAAMANAE
jgi:hypothetical protein